MIIPDTSVWIEFLKSSPQFFETFEKLLEEGKIFALECVFGELLQGVRSKNEKEIILGYWQNLPKAAHESIWITAGILSSEGKYHSKGVGLIDLAIFASARKSKCKVWTLDKKLRKILPSSQLFH